MFDDMLDDPENAAVLFEMVEPSLPRPTAVMREFTPVPRIPRWTLRTPAGAFRLKLAGEVGTAAALARGAGVLAALRSGALRAGALRSGLEDATVMVPTPRCSRSPPALRRTPCTPGVAAARAAPWSTIQPFAMACRSSCEQSPRRWTTPAVTRESSAR